MSGKTGTEGPGRLVRDAAARGDLAEVLVGLGAVLRVTRWWRRGAATAGGGGGGTRASRSASCCCTAAIWAGRALSVWSAVRSSAKSSGEAGGAAVQAGAACSAGKPARRR